MHAFLKQVSFGSATEAYQGVSPLIRAAFLATFVGGLALASPVLAASPDQPEPAQIAENQTIAPLEAGKNSKSKMDMEQRVETRIATLHSKLQITAEQEAAWGAVAQTMRDNEAVIHDLVRARHQNPQEMTAVDDLRSYAAITQAHADGLKKLVSTFQELYAEMSPEQMKVADKVFGGFEGHRGGAPVKKHK